MKPLFVDTSGWYDLLFVGAPHHAEIAAIMRRPEARFVISTYMLDELAALMLSRQDHGLAARAGTLIRSAAEVRVEHPDAAEELRTWEHFLERPDKTYTLTDCLSFVMMRRLSLDTAVATDDHFRREDFARLP
jgi:predicted nucleic acid-binding protein